MNLIMMIFKNQPIWLIEIITGVWEVIRVVIGLGIVCGIVKLVKRIKIDIIKFKRGAKDGYANVRTKDKKSVNVYRYINFDKK